MHFSLKSCIFTKCFYERDQKAGAAANKASDGCASSPKCSATALLIVSIFPTSTAKSKRILKQGIKLEDQTY